MSLCGYFLMWTGCLDEEIETMSGLTLLECVAHFRMSRSTTELLTTEVLRTGKIPTGAIFIEMEKKINFITVKSKAAPKSYVLCRVQQKWKFCANGR